MRNDKDRAHMEITPTTLLPGSPVVCLVCDRTIRDPHGRDIHNLFLESSVTSHSHQPLATILADVLRAPLNANEVYSKTLCVRCMKLVDELDDLQCRADAIKTSLFSRYNRSFIKRLKLPGPDAALGGGIGLENEDEEVEIEVDDRLVARLCVKKEEEPECDDDDDDDDTLRPEDQGILPDDPEFNPARDDSAWLGVRARTRGRPRGRGRGRGRGRPRGRGRGRGRGPGRPPKIPRDSERATTSSESLGEKLGALVTKILGEDEDEHTGEEKKVKLGSAEGEGESKGDEESLDATATSPKLFPCPYCSYTTPHPQTLVAHKSAAHRDLDCPHCGRLLATWWSYERHQRTFHPGLIPENVERERKALQAALQPPPAVPGQKRRGRKRKVQKCETCGLVFKSRPALTYHTATKHSTTMYMCEQCSAVFPHRALLASHSLRHGERRVMCHRCGRKFFTHKQLNSHENLFHRRARSYCCEKCGGRFSTLRVLRHHMRTQPHHKFFCQECGVSFIQRQQYNTHMLTHKLRCTLCNQTFASATAAHQHYRKTHGNQDANPEPITTDPSKNNNDRNASDPQMIKPENDMHTNRTHQILSNLEPVPVTDSHLTSSHTRPDRQTDNNTVVWNEKELSEWVSAGSNKVVVKSEESKPEYQQQQQQQEDEENSVVIILTSEGSEEITFYTQETQEPLHYIIEDDDK